MIDHNTIQEPPVVVDCTIIHHLQTMGFKMSLQQIRLNEIISCQHSSGIGWIRITPDYFEYAMSADDRVHKITLSDGAVLPASHYFIGGAA